ncbi:O-antigen/teichoic acid export membrane protein [Bradyrhizobium sp. AZCC 1614]
MSLKRRVLSAGIWSLAGFGAVQVIRFGSNLIMTRLLAPEMFGLMAISTVVMIGLALFSDLGLRTNIIRSSRGEDPAFLNTAWIIQIFRGLLLWVAACGVAASIAIVGHLGTSLGQGIYADPRLPEILVVLSFTSVILGFSTTKYFEASRRLSLGRITLIEIVSQIMGILFIFAWLSLDRSIWALVAGAICASLVSTILGHLYLPGVRNRWTWDPAAFREIFHFGKWLFLSSILGFLAMNGDRLMLGGMTNATFLGVYSIAFGIVAAIEQVLVRIVASVAFPAISEIAREHPSKVGDTYYRMHILIAAIAYFCSGTLVVSGQALIGVLYDARYAGAGWILEVLAAGLVVIPLQLANYTFLALGKPWMNSTISAVRTALLFVGMPAGFYIFGVEGAIWGLVMSQLLSAPLIIMFAVQTRLFAARREIMVLPMLAVGFAAGKLFVELVRYWRP